MVADHLWEALATMASEMGVDREALVNQALYTFARLNGYVLPTELRGPASVQSTETPLIVRPAEIPMGVEAPPSEAPSHREGPQREVPSRDPAAHRDLAAHRAPAAQRDAPPHREMASQREPAAEREVAPHREIAAQREPVGQREPVAQRETVGQRDQPPEREPAPQREAAPQHEPTPQRPPITDEMRRVAAARLNLPDMGDLEPDTPARPFPPVAPAPPSEPDVEAQPAAAEGKVLVLLSEGRELERVTKDRFLIGRGKHCDLIINSGKVSREHAAILRENGAYFIEDLGSSNGTWFEKRRIGRRQIHEGDDYFICAEKLSCTFR
jgi:hypothetical protein